MRLEADGVTAAIPEPSSYLGWAGLTLIAGAVYW